MSIPFIQYKSEVELFSRLSEEEFARHFFKKMRDEFEEAYIFNRWQHNQEYTYSGTFFRFVWNGFNRFNGVWGGSLKINKDNGLITVKSVLDFREIFIYCIIFTLIPIMDYGSQMSYRIITFALIWIIYIANYIVSLVRINSFLKEQAFDVFINCDNTYKHKLLS